MEGPNSGTVDRHTQEWAVVVLTRGYELVEGYSDLIRRTRSIDAKVAGQFDHVIFHEGNIPQIHQDYIRSKCQSPHPMMFRNVQHVFESINPRTDGLLCTETSKSKTFPRGYRAMCKFWTGIFMQELSRYKFCLRVDEDCDVIWSKSIDKMTTGSIRCVRMQTAQDHPGVIQGMHAFFSGLDKNFPETWHSPYTNVVVFNLQWARSSVIKSISDKILATRCIDTNRWGDLPLWGAIMTLQKIENEELPMRYYHGSHYYKVGGSHADNLAHVAAVAPLIVCNNWLIISLAVVYIVTDTIFTNGLFLPFGITISVFGFLALKRHTNRWYRLWIMILFLAPMGLNLWSELPGALDQNEWLHATSRIAIWVSLFAFILSWPTQLMRPSFRPLNPTGMFL